MKIERIASNKIKVTLTTFDLQSYDIDLKTASVTPEKVEEIFRRMLYLAELEEGFLTHDSQLMIEAKPGNMESGELVMYITKIDPPQKMSGMRTLPKNIKLKARKKPGEEDLCDLLFCFTSLDDIINCLKSGTLPMISGSILFKHQDIYCLQIRTERQLQKTTELFFCEYARVIKAPYTFAYLKEHGEVLIPNNATAHLLRHF